MLRIHFHRSRRKIGIEAERLAENTIQTNLFQVQGLCIYPLHLLHPFHSLQRIGKGIREWFVQRTPAGEYNSSTPGMAVLMLDHRLELCGYLAYNFFNGSSNMSVPVPYLIYFLQQFQKTAFFKCIRPEGKEFLKSYLSGTGLPPGIFN